MFIIIFSLHRTSLEYSFFQPPLYRVAVGTKITFHIVTGIPCLFIRSRRGNLTPINRALADHALDAVLVVPRFFFGTGAVTDETGIASAFQMKTLGKLF